MFKLSVSGPNSNFPVSGVDVSTYAPIQGSTYPMAGITSLRPNPQTRSTFWDTDATGVRRNLNIGQEQSPMKTPEMPQLPKEGAFTLGYRAALEKVGLSLETIDKVYENARNKFLGQRWWEKLLGFDAKGTPALRKAWESHIQKRAPRVVETLVRANTPVPIATDLVSQFIGLPHLRNYRDVVSATNPAGSSILRRIV